VHTEKEFVEACIEAGAKGYVRKSDMKDHLVSAIQIAFAGRSYLP
jgi:DNA-binding NarL/FixJ family response regulator